MQVLVIDAANVVGSRPDGWWRDRAGAARRLWQQLQAVDLPETEVDLVLEGAAREGVTAGTTGHVHVVHADGHGDDAIVEAARRRLSVGCAVTVVTADRELQARAEDVGAEVATPSWLLQRL